VIGEVDGGWPPLSRALAAFDRINPQNAMHVVRNWRRDPKYQEAIEKIASSGAVGQD